MACLCSLKSLWHKTVLTIHRFLWVFFQFEDVCAQTSDGDIRKAIPSLPKDLLEAYHRALYKIVGNTKAELSAKMFRWVAATKRPLSLAESREAIAMKPYQTQFMASQLVNDIEQIVPSCGTLLTLDEEEHIVQFAHHTVKEYLLFKSVDMLLRSFNFEIADIDHAAGDVCCTSVQFSDFKRQLVPMARAHVAHDPMHIMQSSLSANVRPVFGRSWSKADGLWRSQRSLKTSQVRRHLQFISVAEIPDLLQTLHSFLTYASEH